MGAYGDWWYAEWERCQCECVGGALGKWAHPFRPSTTACLRHSPCLQLSFIFANVSEQDIIAKVRGGGGATPVRSVAASGLGIALLTLH